MLIYSLKLLKQSARNLKNNNAIRKPIGAQKIKFTEEQLTELGSPIKKDKPSLREAFGKKYAQKFDEFVREFQNPDKIEFQKSAKDKSEKFAKKPLPKHVPRQERIKPEEMTLQDFSSVRLEPQFLPISYMRQAQKIFSKYGQTRLRQIANNFSKLTNLRYSEEKLDFQQYENLGFGRLEERVPKDKQIEQIYLIGQAKLYSDSLNEKKTTRKPDDDPINPEISYTQNIVVSYLLNRVPRTFATAVRIMTELRYKYPDLKPKSFLDFGAGLGSGATAFIDVFGDTKQVYAVEPSSKMRKLSQYLTEGQSIRHYQTLGEMSSQIRQVDVIYAGYVVNELRSELVEVYLQALYAKVKNYGFLIFAEHGSPFGSRIMHEIRKWALEKKMYIAAPCPHHLKCPLARQKSWCHFDQPSGIFPSNIFGKLPTDQAIKYEKFSYLILQKQAPDEQLPIFKVEPNITKQWDRVIYPLMKRGKHVILNLCTKAGRFERRISAKSHGPQYKEIKKLRWGDYWRFGKRIPNRFRKERKTGKRLW